MKNVGLTGLPLVALAGADHVRPLTDPGLAVVHPMKGKSIGASFSGSTGRTPDPSRQIVARYWVGSNRQLAFSDPVRM
jgi:hypothetical protein